MLTLNGVSKRYNGKEALKNVDLSLPRGEIIGLFGENGAGKTTLMKAILGLITFKGTILLDGREIDRSNIHQISFATSEHSFFPAMNAASHGEFYREHFPNYSKKRFRSLMEFFELPHHKPLRAFSAGQQNQFEVILALSQGADYILLDEPFAGNDIFNREDFYKVLLGILEPNETVLLSTHLIEEVSDFIGRAVLINKGVILGDFYTEALEEKGDDLMSYIKRTYHYRPERVRNALSEMTGREE